MTHWSINILRVNDNTFLLYTCRYATLWIAPIVLVGYSFGGLVLKSLVVDVHKRISQKVTNPYEKITMTNCKRFLENLKGIIFYGVPHTGGLKELLKYFISQSPKMNSINKKLIKAQSSLLNNIISFNRQMEQLSVDFDDAIEANVNIYAFGEGKPLNQNGVHSKDSMTLTLFQLIFILHCFECLKIVFDWFYLIMIKTKDLSLIHFRVFLLEWYM